MRFFAIVLLMRSRMFLLILLFFVVIDYLFRVVHAAVTDLDGVSVEDFS